MNNLTIKNQFNGENMKYNVLCMTKNVFNVLKDTLTDNNVEFNERYGLILDTDDGTLLGMLVDLGVCVLLEENYNNNAIVIDKMIDENVSSTTSLITVKKKLTEDHYIKMNTRKDVEVGSIILSSDFVDKYHMSLEAADIRNILNNKTIYHELKQYTILYNVVIGSEVITKEFAYEK